MHYFQMAFLAHEYQEELLRKAHEGRLAHMPSDRPIGMMA